MKKYLLLLCILICSGLQVLGAKSSVPLTVFRKGQTDKSTTVLRTPMHLPIEIFYDDETQQVQISGDDTLDAEVYTYDYAGNEENYSSTLNVTFQLYTPGTHIILIQGDGWYAEGHVEI